MSVRDEFDAWAADGRDKGMEDRHWHTAKHALARMPVEEGDSVVDLGTGSGYALRALYDTKHIGRGVGLDGSPEMVQNAREYTDTEDITYLVGDFDDLPFADDSVDHVWSMEAFYYAPDPHHTLEEVARILKPGGTFYCAVNYYEENVHSHHWQDNISIEMTRWSHEKYRQAFRDAGLYVAEQDSIADMDIEIPSADEFPTDSWETRQDMVDRYRTFGTLLTVGVAP
ncbi:methyltransferase domain-containing protein [Haloferax sp. MBLA0076]|uniref:Methyltransferase domain-containing protein n=1 Tax=Haloferax litoreum TaxID=2666140 RepID=A0A6A8GI19_9EURY|nr:MULTISPECIES: class I SAM-dependent methyltransferase [Haloferax]KAB1192875.1 class I SAM-dependent methyltransferase [Haloferax sp. CBA1148]MRX21360.1 methyltransferase domain-containing protein [Haloferax litoreum]